MSEIDQYIRVLFFRTYDTLALATSYERRETVTSQIGQLVGELLAKSKAEGITDIDVFSTEIFEELLRGKLFGRAEEKFAGTYFQYRPRTYGDFRGKVLSEDKINVMADAIGARFFPDVFEGYRGESEKTGGGFPALGVAPASNRIVTFSDNQITDLDRDTTKVIEAVSDKNQIDDNPGLRELVLGQLRAGRELIRAGTVRAYLVQVTLIETLQFLAKRYEREVVGALAAALVTALISHLGLAT